jgi:large subunit ribosomal protein L30
VNQLSEENKCLAVVRIRGSTGMTKEREEIMRQLRLTRKNHATLLSSSDSVVGTLRRIKDYVTWGEVDLKTIELLLRERGMLEGGQRLTEENVKQNLRYASLAELAKELYEGNVKLPHVKGLKPIFRLHPPARGFKGSTKKPYPEGELGYRSDAICALLSRMT